ncbi:MAG: condensation domain-containing protein, partial [Bacteroidota bacterium]
VESGSATTIPKIERKAFYQTSYAQKRCYFEQEIDKRSTINNTTSVHRIIGKLDHDKLDKTFQALVDRHEGLRTHFEVSGNEVVSNIEVTASIACEYLDGSDYPLLEEALDAFIRPFDLSSCPLLRYGIYQNDKQGDFLLVDIHHIVCDGVSLNILMNDFIRLYSGDTLPPLALDYVDYAVWQQAGIDTLEKQRTYWAEQLLPTYFEPDLPTLQDRGSVKVHAADRSELKISTELSDKIKSYVTETGVSNFMFFLSCYYILLSKMSGSDDIIISTNSIGRTQKELENIVGSFVNLIPLRADIKPEMVYDDFLSQVKTNVLMALENQDFQYDDMVLMTEGNGSSNILDLFFSYINFFDAQSTTGELSFSPVKLKVNQEVARFGLELIISEYGDHFQVGLRYSSDLYDRETIELFTQYYYNIVQCVLLDRNMTIENIEFEFTMI